MTGKERIARRIAREFKDGFYVNLGIGLPTMIAGYIPAGIDVMFQSENGMLGVGGPPTDEQADPDLDQRGKAAGDGVAGVLVLWERGVVCDDSRRAYGYEHPGRDAGG